MALILLIGLAVIRSWWGTQLDSFTPDEPYHMVAGISYVQTGDFRLNPEHPPLTKLWVGWWAPKNFKLRPFQPLNDKYAERNFLEETMYYDNDFDAAQTHARVSMWGFNGILMLILLCLVWRIWHFTVAVVVALFLAVEPTVSAHMPVVMTDLPLGLAVVIMALCASLLMRDWQYRWAMALIVTTGCALAIKFSTLPAVLAVYIILGLAAFKPAFQSKWRTTIKRLSMLLIVGVLSVGLLWASYGFQYHSSDDGSDQFNRTVELKINDLNSPVWQDMLHFTDQNHLLPRSYIWGLADTVRAGIEGRGAPRYFIYGVKFQGDAPWFLWPAVLLSKIPIPLLLLSITALFVSTFHLGKALLIRQELSITNQTTLALLFMSLIYLITLMSSQGAYAGIRHAMPLVVVAAVLSGTLYFYLKQPFKLWVMPVIFISVLFMTLPERRLWEYHNETVGGTKNAYKYFSNEGLKLGQREKEVQQFVEENQLQSHNRYGYLWLIEEELKARGVGFSKVVKDIDDDNYEGIYEGYFFMSTSSLMPWEGWDPAMLEQLDFVTRMGNLYVMRGRYVDPMDWARAMSRRIQEYLFETENPDWDKVVMRLEQVIQRIDYRYNLYVDLANAYLRVEEREKSIQAYEKAYELTDESHIFRNKITAQIVLLQSGVELKQVGLLRPDNIE